MNRLQPVPVEVARMRLMHYIRMNFPANFNMAGEFYIPPELLYLPETKPEHMTLIGDRYSTSTYCL